MAKLTKFKISLLVLSLLLGVAATSEAKPNLSSEIDDLEAGNAFRIYWNAYNNYEEQVIKDGIKKHKSAWKALKQEFVKNKIRLNEQELQLLRSSKKRYIKQLEQHGNASNRPFVMLNLAQVLNLMANIQQENYESIASQNKSQALNLLINIEKQYPQFSKREEALYLRALILTSEKREKEALGVWKLLASIAKNSLYGVHGLVAVGDYYFNLERSDFALTYYSNAEKLLKRIQTANKEYEMVRILYRIAWSAYRSAKLNLVVKKATLLLNPELKLKTIRQKRLIRKDAIDLISDALYEQDDFQAAKKYLSQKSLSNDAAAIALGIMKRYGSTEIYEEVIKYGEFITQKYPLNLYTPSLLLALATSYKFLNLDSKKLATLEKLALLLPKDSLWRSRYRENFDAIKKMEKDAFAASRILAISYYDKAMTSGNPKYYSAADTYYGIMLEAKPNHKLANKWRLRRGHCKYFSNRFDQAILDYNNLKQNYSVSNEILEVASYQLVLSYDKLWHNAVSEALANGAKLEDDKKSLGMLKELRRVTDDFANKFQGQKRSVDVLLILANAYRDQGLYEKADKTWQRSLLSMPTPEQRSIAIRGMLFAAIKKESPLDVVITASRFLDLEDWKTLGPALANELKEVLSVAALDESRNLNKKGKLLEAGRLLVKLANKYKDLPNRSKIYRDGSYMLAISGAWEEARKAAQAYIDSPSKEYRGDMLYLIGRTNEYQIRFKESQKYYLKLGKNYPKHSRAITALERAEKLSFSENNYEDAGLASELLAKIKPKSRLHYLQKSFSYYMAANNTQKSIYIAKLRLKYSKSIKDRLQSKLMIASATYTFGNEEKALRQYKNIALDASRNRSRLENKDYAEVVGESYFKLAEEERSKFDDFDIFERSGSAKSNLITKMKYFKRMTTYYQKSAQVNSPEWSPQSRFKLSEASETLADDLASLIKRESKSISQKSQNQYKLQIKKLRNISLIALNQNINMYNRNPGIYAQNEWIKKSKIKLNMVSRDKMHFKEKLPAAVQLELPYQWSL